MVRQPRSNVIVVVPGFVVAFLQITHLIESSFCQDQATWIRGIIWIFFNHNSRLQSVSYFVCSYLVLEHSLNCMQTICDCLVDHGRPSIDSLHPPSIKSFLISENRIHHLPDAWGYLCQSFVRGSVRSLDSGDRNRIPFWHLVGENLRGC